MSHTFRRILPALVLLLCLASPAMAQIKVELSIKRSIYIVYEPIIASIAITNLAGRDIVLKDSGVHRWFGFNIETAEGGIIPPVNTDYTLDPLEIPAGATVRRSVNMIPLYAIRETGLYRIRATIFSEEFDKYFTSNQQKAQVVDGQLSWQQTIGVPESMENGGEMRTVKLLTHRGSKDKNLYVQVENADEGMVYAIFKLGRLVQSQEPEVVLDAGNSVHILQLAAPRTYLYSVVSPLGEWQGQKRYFGTRRPPHLQRLEDGNVGIVGGVEDAPVQLPEGMAEMPKLSDRPAGMPR